MLWLPRRCWTVDLHNKGTVQESTRQIHSQVVQLREGGSEWPQTPALICQRWPVNPVKRWKAREDSQPLSLPRACLSARIAENLGQPVLSRVELLSFVYFYILKDHTVPKTSGPILFTNKLQHTATQLKQHKDLAKPEPHIPKWLNVQS